MNQESSRKSTKRTFSRNQLTMPAAAGLTASPTTIIDDDEVKKTNVEVCVRVRPMFVSSSSVGRFFEKRKVRGGQKPKGRSERTSRLPSPRSSNLPTSPFKSQHSSGTHERTSSFVSSPEQRVDKSIDAWDVLSNDTVSQSAASGPVQGRTNSYTLDNVYGPNSNNESLYNGSVRNVILSAMQGYHTSVFTYGQTSTGKTFTMTGSKESPGIVPLAVRDCFQYVSNSNSPREYVLRVSYMEIYNEQVVDLLRRTSTSAPSPIRIFESKAEGVVVRGLQEEVVTSPEQVYAFLAAGEARRKTGRTNMNAHSSRSHCIFRLLIESQAPPSGGGGGGPVRVSSLSLVDLAGSESVRLSGAIGERRKEGQYINKSLMALGQVIHKLSEFSMHKNGDNCTLPPKHIPYRDSKLTRLLQPSLSGNAQIVIVCNISPQVLHLEESHNTLKFAMRAKKIQQKASITEVSDEKTLLQNYREEIDELRRQLKEAKEAHTMLQEQKTTIQEKEPPSDDSETQELVEAIQQMEKLILKANLVPTQTPRPQKSMEGDEFLLSFLDDDSDDAGSSTDQDESKNSQPSITDELHRIQGLLGSVLQRKGRGISLSDGVLDDSLRRNIFQYSSPALVKDTEVHELRAQLHEKEVTTSLRIADSSFLQSQLVEKDNLLREVSGILDALERRQLELEAENAELRKKLRDTKEDFLV